MYSLVQAFTLTVWLHFLIHCSNNRLFKLTVGTLRSDLSEFQGQNFKVGGTLGAELACFCIQVGLQSSYGILVCTNVFYNIFYICNKVFM